MDEFDVIAALLRPLAPTPAALGLADDAALIKPPPGKTLVVTQDAIISAVHFVGDEPAGLIACKLLRANLSDLAAMGAEPYGYFLALMLPEGTGDDWLEAFAAGLKADQDRYGITLLGGDTTRTGGPLALSATFLGYVPQGKALLRNGAQAGDRIYVSGTLGDAALGLAVARGDTAFSALAEPHRAFLLDRYRLPRPQLALGMALRGIASACMDISDGLVQDLGHLMQASGCAAILEAERLPLSAEALAALALKPPFCLLPLTGGDDYELLFTVPAVREADIINLQQKLGIILTRVGNVAQGEGTVSVHDAKGADILIHRKGYRHGW